MLGLDIDKVKQLTKTWVLDLFFQPKPLYKHALNAQALKLEELSLERRYARIPSAAQSLEAFYSLRRVVFEAFSTHSHLEYGQSQTQRAYFFVQPFDKKGWVFEHTDRGWIVYRAYKDSQQSGFLRDLENEDSCELMFAVDEPKLFRLNSARFSLELVSLAYYVKKLKVQMDHD